MPTEKTKADYRKLAQHFYEKRLGDEPPSPKRIADALKACAGEYRPAYWRRLRNALELDQREKGYQDAAERIKRTINPMTTDAHGPLDKGLRGEVPPKQRRAKSISQEDRAKLWKAAKALDDQDETCAAIFLAEQLGVRPAEMPGLQIDEKRGIVRVMGVKRTAERGADRDLTLPDDPRIRKNIGICVRKLAKVGPEGVRRIQSRLDRLSRKLWPRRQARPSLYTFRHQMGAELKSMKVSRRAIAYIMGHQSTQSVEVYGDRRKSRGGIGIKLTGQEATRFQGRENHTAAPDGIPESTIPPALRESGKAPETPVQQGLDQPKRPSGPPSKPKGPSGPGM